MENAIKQAVEKLQNELAAIEQPYIENPIVEYIVKNLDESLAACIVLDHKSVKKCVEYINAEAHKKLGGKNGGLPDQDVYDMAVAYFRLDDAEEARKKAEEAEQRRQENEERKRKAKEKQDAETARKAAEKAAKDGQLSLFDLAGAASNG